LHETLESLGSVDKDTGDTAAKRDKLIHSRNLVTQLRNRLVTASCMQVVIAPLLAFMPVMNRAGASYYIPAHLFLTFVNLFPFTVSCVQDADVAQAPSLVRRYFRLIKRSTYVDLADSRGTGLLAPTASGIGRSTQSAVEPHAPTRHQGPGLAKLKTGFLARHRAESPAPSHFKSSHATTDTALWDQVHL